MSSTQFSDPQSETESGAVSMNDWAEETSSGSLSAPSDLPDHKQMFGGSPRRHCMKTPGASDPMPASSSQVVIDASVTYRLYTKDRRHAHGEGLIIVGMETYYCAFQRDSVQQLHTAFVMDENTAGDPLSEAFKQHLWLHVQENIQFELLHTELIHVEVQTT